MIWYSFEALQVMKAKIPPYPHTNQKQSFNTKLNNFFSTRNKFCGLSKHIKIEKS